MQRKVLSKLFCLATLVASLGAAPTLAVAQQLSQGLASWYGPGFSGNKTASGERFDPSAMTAAHRSLPFGTQVRVTNVQNGRSVIVRINDRMGGSRAVIDLSMAAAKAIGIWSAGIAPVKMEVLPKTKPNPVQPVKTQHSVPSIEHLF